MCVSLSLSIYIYTYIYIYIYIYTYIYRQRPAGGRSSQGVVGGGTKYLSKATCLIQASFGLCVFVVSRTITLLYDLQLLKKSRVRQVVLDKWSPLKFGGKGSKVGLLEDPGDRLGQVLAISLPLYNTWLH